MYNLINVFLDTEKHSEQFNTSKTSIHSDVLGPFLSVYDKDNQNILVENTDTVSSLIKWSKFGRTAILNMASSKRPGGGVRNGARAQEECLFRCSNLIHSVSTDFYSLEDNICLYTEEAVFFKDYLYNYIEPIKCDVITIPALNLNKSETINNYEKETMNKIRVMLSTPSKFGVKNLILGSWGCGVFKNDPEKISNYFKMVLIDEGYHSLYDKVIFAIINDHNSVSNNYKIFNKNIYGY